NGGVSCNLLADRLHRRMGTQKAVGQSLVLTQQAQEQVFGFNIRRAELARFIPRKEDHASRFFCVPFEHVTLTWDTCRLASASKASLSSPRYEPPHFQEEALFTGLPFSVAKNQRRLANEESNPFA